jgi:hypothetical protein
MHIQSIGLLIVVSSVVLFGSIVTYQYMGEQRAFNDGFASQVKTKCLAVQ